jgi:hypothetical protein
MAQFQTIEPYEHGLLDVGKATRSTGNVAAIPRASPRFSCMAVQARVALLVKEDFSIRTSTRLFCSISGALAVAYHSQVN